MTHKHQEDAWGANKVIEFKVAWIDKHMTQKIMCVKFNVGTKTTIDAIGKRLGLPKWGAINRESLANIKSRGEQWKKERPKTATRDCMTCGRPFASAGPGNRLCPEHRVGNGLGNQWMMA